MNFVTVGIVGVASVHIVVAHDEIAFAVALRTAVAIAVVYVAADDTVEFGGAVATSAGVEPVVDVELVGDVADGGGYSSSWVVDAEWLPSCST